MFAVRVTIWGFYIGFAMRVALGVCLRDTTFLALSMLGSPFLKAEY